MKINSILKLRQRIASKKAENILFSADNISYGAVSMVDKGNII
jgi:hypothetical protein